MSHEPDHYEDFSFYESPPPWQPPSALSDREPPPSKRNYLTPIIGILLVIILVGGSLYAALRPFVNKSGTTNFNAILTGISAQRDCDDAPRITRYGTITPTRDLCVCGRIFTETGENATFFLRLKNNNNATITTKRIKAQRPGYFCQHMGVEKGLLEGGYILEISPTDQHAPITWLRFSVIQGNESA